MRSRFTDLTLDGLLLVALPLDSPANAQPAADFYKGKTVTLVVGSTPGGGYDAYARTLARFYGAHIPGSPNVVVQNMPGGGSLTSVLYLDKTAAKDGTVLTIFNPGVMTASIIDPAEAKLNFASLAWVGSVTPDFRICYTGRKSGVATWDDLAKGDSKGQAVTFGATGQASLSYNDTQMLRSLFGRNVRAILGYPGRSEVHLAIERGELDGECGSVAGLPEDWLRDSKINVPLRLVEAPVPGVPASTPYIGAFAKTDEERSILNILTAANELGRPFIVSKQVPDDRLATLRDAFDATMKDVDFLAASARQNLTVIPTTGQTAQRMVEKLYDVSPELARKAKDAIK
jgi:tripartite-type tricarboxylate transporter receptor subunit TctC